MRISDWSSDVCSSDLHFQDHDVDMEDIWPIVGRGEPLDWGRLCERNRIVILADAGAGKTWELKAEAERLTQRGRTSFFIRIEDIDESFRSEEHTSELQSLMRISYAVFCLKKKT